MVDILILLLINSAVCLGFWNACYYEVKKGNVQIGSEYDSEHSTEEIKGVLWFIDKWSKDKWFYKPLCGCLPCMASFHSIYPYWSAMYFGNNLSIEAIVFYPIYIIALSGINYLIDRE